MLLKGPFTFHSTPPCKCRTSCNWVSLRAPSCLSPLNLPCLTQPHTDNPKLQPLDDTGMIVNPGTCSSEGSGADLYPTTTTLQLSTTVVEILVNTVLNYFRLEQHEHQQLHGSKALRATLPPVTPPRAAQAPLLQIQLCRSNYTTQPC
eukprot:918292-Amphidinium_carterae.1